MKHNTFLSLNEEDDYAMPKCQSLNTRCSFSNLIRRQFSPSKRRRIWWTHRSVGCLSTASLALYPAVEPGCGGSYFSDATFVSFDASEYLRNVCGANLSGISMIFDLVSETERLRAEVSFLRR